MERCRQSRGPPAHDRDPLLARRYDRRKRPTFRERLVADIAFEPADRQRPVNTRAIAGGFARVVTDAPGYRGEGVVAGEDFPRAAKVAGAGTADPLGDVAIHRAGGVAR